MNKPPIGLTKNQMVEWYKKANHPTPNAAAFFNHCSERGDPKSAINAGKQLAQDNLNWNGNPKTRAYCSAEFLRAKREGEI